ncbi:VOC family protein [Phenylobacterium sp.]|uniref:VOC family protein n=1 Tax=Phenylobacterium sp. TaxID=1871053 RepID=UPI0027239307|nr:VOC family protein [Phenylobacterium sp.]MDO8377669.1 VOC family protein [Phenylobacterium sp.]
MTRPAISPVIWYREPRVALAWLEGAFGFETTLVVDDGAGGVIHSETMIEGGVVMIVGPPRDKATTPVAFGGRATQSVHVQLSGGIDAHCERARAAGARIEREPETQAYGDRVYTCLDPEDHPWSFGQTVQVLTQDQVARATGHDIVTSL